MKKMFYRLAVLAIFLLPSVPSQSNDEREGINFFEGTWQETLQRSATENKLIFLDISTSWCGWCKKMKQNTYSDKKVAAYFNAHFINVELDGEHSEGRRLAHKFGVSGYPSIYIVDKNENQLLSSEGYHDPGDLLNLVKAAMKETK
jgi:thioredoxin